MSAESWRRTVTMTVTMSPSHMAAESWRPSDGDDVAVTNGAAIMLSPTTLPAG